MRTFEVALLLVNFLLLFWGLKKQSRTIVLGLAGVNMIVFSIHALFEGLRYQMVFSYVFVILFTMYAIIKTNDKFSKVKISKALKWIAVSLSFLLLLFTS